MYMCLSTYFILMYMYIHKRTHLYSQGIFLIYNQICLKASMERIRFHLTGERKIRSINILFGKVNHFITYTYVCSPLGFNLKTP